MEDKKQIPYVKRLTDLENRVEELEKKNGFELNEDTSLFSFVLISSLFGSFDTKSKTEGLEKRLEKLETKNEMLEKIVLK